MVKSGSFSNNQTNQLKSTNYHKKAMKLKLPSKLNTHVLIVDDNQPIHDDFKKTLFPSNGEIDIDIKNLESALFDDENEIQADQTDLTDLTYQIDDAYQGEESIEMVQAAEDEDNPYALIFMDVRMPPGMNGIKAISKIWDINPNIEIVICSAYSDYSWDEIVSKLGNTDQLLFLKKPFSPIEVKQMVHSLVIKWNLNHQNQHLIENLENEVKQRTRQLENLYVELEVANRVLEEKNQILKEVAQQDGLTGLFNHVALCERLAAVLSEARRHHFPFSVAMIDVDNFKQHNDYYGHQFGDEIIKNVASSLQANLRHYDIKLRHISEEYDQRKKYREKDGHGQVSAARQSGIVGRYGGDEFSLILPYCGHEEADKILGRIQEDIRSIRLQEQPDLRITASLGAGAVDTPDDCEDGNSIIKLADEALYRAKKNGRDQICILELTKG